MKKLFPPSHFDQDSLNESPQAKSSNEANSSPNLLSNIKFQPILKTPSDFCASSQSVLPEQVPFQAKTNPSSNFNAKSYYVAHGISQDSGYDWDCSKGDVGTCSDKLQLLLTALREENNLLHHIIKKSQSEKVHQEFLVR